MNQLCTQMWQEEDGVLTFEWILLLTLLVIGIIGGLAGVRDAIIDELGDVAQATISLDQSYVLATVDITSSGGNITVTLVGSEFTDELPLFEDCIRNSIDGQPPGF